MNIYDTSCLTNRYGERNPVGVRSYTCAAIHICLCSTGCLVGLACQIMCSICVRKSDHMIWKVMWSRMETKINKITNLYSHICRAYKKYT